MRLHDILDKSKAKRPINDADTVIRTADIAKDDRPYRESSAPKKDDKRETDGPDALTHAVVNQSVEARHKGGQKDDRKYLNLPKYLSGNERRLYEFLSRNRIPGNVFTGAITKDVMLSGVMMPESGLKKTLERLVKKGIVRIHLSKNGKYGWREFEILQ